MTADSAPPQLSPDGYWWWTGVEWVPAAQLFAAQESEHPVQTEPERVEKYLPAARYVNADQIPAQQQQSWQPVIPTQQLPVFEILTADAAPAPKPKRGRAAIAGTVAAVVLIGAGGAYGVNRFLGGGGQQPEDVLPANAAAVVKVDLDPSLSQKAALYRLSRAFPQLHLRGEDSVKDDLLRPLFTNPTMSYDRDVKPWLGDRVAVAAVPDRSPSGFAPVAAVQYTDKDKAKRTLLAASARAATGSDPFFFAFSGEYAVIATTQAAANSYASAGTHLSDNTAYSKAVASLDGDQIAVAWADLARVYAGFPAAARKANPLFGNMRVAPTGAFVVGAHAASSYLEVQGKAVDVSEGLKQLGAFQFGQARTANLIATLPSNTVAAMEVTGLGDVVTKAYAALPPPIKDAADGLGLKMPGDLAVILGTDTAIGVVGDLEHPGVIAHVKTANPAGAVTALNRLGRTIGSDAPWCPCKGGAFSVRRDAGGYTLSTDPTVTSTGRLGSTASFTRAVPDAKGAGMVLYVNLKALPPGVARGVQGLEAVGMSVDGASGAFRLRLTTG